MVLILFARVQSMHVSPGLRGLRDVSEEVVCRLKDSVVKALAYRIANKRDKTYSEAMS